MSSPFVQFELDAAKKAPTLASALRVSLSVAMGGLIRMWLRVYEGEDEITAFYLRNFFEAEPELVGEALVELGFVTQIDGSKWRVKGAGRYTRIHNVRSEAGRKGAEATNAKRKVASANAEDSRQDVRQKSGKTPFAEQQTRQKAALEPIADRLSPTERESISDGSPVSAPPQPALGGAGRGAVSPEPATPHEPPPTPQPRELCAAGHPQIPGESCFQCRREASKRRAEDKREAEQAVRDRIAAIPLPPKGFLDESLSDDEVMAQQMLFLERTRARLRGENWQESMPV